MENGEVGIDNVFCIAAHIDCSHMVAPEKTAFLLGSKRYAIKINPTSKGCLEDKFRGTLIQILGGLTAGATVLIALLSAIRKRFELSADTLITDRFTKAIDQLAAVDERGGKKVEQRLGAIYGLERIAGDSPRDHWPIMEILTAYVRNNFAAEQPFANPRRGHSSPPVDLQSVVRVIVRRNWDIESDAQILDLSGSDLRGCVFAGANLRKIRLNGANLGGADLKMANMWGAELTGANLYEADVEGAILENANLKDAHLIAANLKRTNLKNAYCENADFLDAALEEAILDLAVLDGAKFEDVADLTKDQIKSAHINEETRLPGSLGIYSKEVN